MTTATDTLPLTQNERRALRDLAREGATTRPAWDTSNTYQTTSGDRKFRSRPRTLTIMKLASRGLVRPDPGTNVYRITDAGRARLNEEAN